MNKEQFDVLSAALEEKGYSRYHQKLYNEDYIICKGFHKYDNQWEENQNAYQIILSVYDYTLPHSFDYRLSPSEKDNVGIEIHVDVSRTIDERIEMLMPWDDDITIDEVEDAAEKFYQFVCKQWVEPRKEEQQE